MAEISRVELQRAVTLATAAITDVKHMSSYDWIEAPTPTMIVPGVPARWAGSEGPRQTAQDSGLASKAQNDAARHPESPLEPLLRALYAENDAVDMSSVHVIADRSNIRKLLSFASPELGQFEPEAAFTLNIEVVQDTAVLCCDEATTQESLGSHDDRRYEHQFEKSYTVPQVPGSTGHHRVISYQFCGLKFMVRYESDAYVADTQDSCSRDSNGSSLSRPMRDLALPPSHTIEYTTIVGSTLRIKKGGQAVPLLSTLEIQTRPIHSPLPFQTVAPQLWIAQTPHLVRAYHDKQGTFQTPRVESVAVPILQWEADHQHSLRKLGWLLKRITALAKVCGGQATVTYDVHNDKLVVARDGGRKLLPADLYAKWPMRAIGAEPNGVVVKAPAAASAATQTNGTGPKTNGNGTTAVHPKKAAMAGAALLPFSDVIQCALDKGFRHVFRRMPPTLPAYLVLCDSLQRLHVDVLQGQHVRELLADMRRGWDPTAARDGGHRIPSGAKRVARDAAFKLVYAFLQQGGERRTDVTMAWSAALFVVAHRRLFAYRTRKMVREVFLGRFAASLKQQRELAKWPVQQDGAEEEEDGGTTTEEEEEEEEEDYFVDSDDSY